jgi:hypothetical protein
VRQITATGIFGQTAPFVSLEAELYLQAKYAPKLRFAHAWQYW